MNQNKLFNLVKSNVNQWLFYFFPSAWKVDQYLEFAFASSTNMKIKKYDVARYNMDNQRSSNGCRKEDTRMM